MSKIYVYLDETGKQRGDRFVVSLVALYEEAIEKGLIIREDIKTKNH